MSELLVPTISRVKCFLWDFPPSTLHQPPLSSFPFNPFLVFHVAAKRSPLFSRSPAFSNHPLTLSLSATRHGPEAPSKELSYPPVARTDFLPSTPFPSGKPLRNPLRPPPRASYPPSTPAASLVVTLPTRAPVYLSNHMVRDRAARWPAVVH